MRTTYLTGLALAGLLLSACTNADEPTRQADLSSLEPLDAGASMTSAGRAMLDKSDFKTHAPRINVTAAADPVSGRVEGVVHARLPVGSAGEVHLRYFAGLDSLQASPTDGPVTVDGKAAEATRDKGLLTVALPSGHADQVMVDVPFSYTLPEAKEPSMLDALGGATLQPADVGLLARHKTELSLGHWFPVWVPPGMRDDAEPKGFGDVSNYPAADLSVQLRVPRGWSVIDGGVRVDETTKGEATTVTSAGTGIRDISVVVVKDYASKSRKVGDVTVRAWGPSKDSKQLDGVLDETAAAISTLSKDFGDYPWKEFDVVSAPLGAGVAGMEWPGAAWIESSAFAGGVPGLGALGDVLGPMLDQLGDVGLLLSSTRAWTIAHEVAHMWWTILVGNDSIASPVVDEPLAQYSACLVARSTRGDAEKVCKLQIASGYDGMKSAGAPDDRADQATDQFKSAEQYAGLVYGKAAWFYLALEKRYGASRVQQALHEVVRQYAFDTITGNQVRGVLVTSLDEQSGALWDHWMEQAHGDEDMPETDLGMGGLGELGDLVGQLGE
jgi:hypothetical protein